MTGGEFSFDGRVFKDDEVDNTEDKNLSVFGRLSTKYEGNKIETVFGGFFRADVGDTDRNLVRLEDAYIKGALNEDETFNPLLQKKQI